jgi:16S rRNA (uracil1498-N3)-methyltransferase
MSDHRRFLIGPDQIAGEMAVLTGGQARQIARVLRLTEGDRVCLLDGSGVEHEAVIMALSGGEVTARIVGTKACESEARVRLTLAVCLPKGDKIELIVQKCTELGISELIVVRSERTVARLDAARTRERLERWHRIAREAAEQSGRARAPEIRGVVEFGDLYASIRESQIALVATEGQGAARLRDVLRGRGDLESVVLIIGPEGGLTDREVALAESAGAKRISLGRRILRCETAAIAACALVMYELDS